MPPISPIRRVSAAALIAVLGQAFTISIARAETKVLATIKPIHSLVSQVMGDTGTPELLVTGSASPHTYVMKPSDARKLATADIIFRVSEIIEPFTTKASKTLPKASQMITLLRAPGVTLLPQRAGGPFEEDDHDHHAGHDHDHDAVDGHIWLDPANAKAMIDAIALTLSAATPERAATYQTNANVAKTNLDRMTAELATTLSPATGRPYVVFHDAYQYFEKRFGLSVVGSITVNPEIPPSGKRLSALRAKLTKLNAACVFGEPNFDAKIIATVTEATAARTGVLDPEGASLPPGPALYETLMRNLARDLTTCLAKPS